MLHPRLAAAEVLEARIAPAGLMVFTDVDGDTVTIKTSVGSFSPDDFVTVPGSIPGVTGGVQIQKIILTNPGDVFTKTSLTVSVKKGALGDGSVNIGSIEAAGVDLKAITVPGDVGRITAGSGLGVGVGTLTVDSLGRAGASAQVAGDNLDSVIEGDLTKLIVKGDVKGASLTVAGAVEFGNLGSLFVGGSLLGGSTNDSGSIVVEGFITGSVNVRGSVVGGAGDDSGQLSASLILGKTTIGGDLQGGTGTRSGAIIASSAGAIKVSGSILGNADADPAVVNAGGIFISGNLAGLTIGENLKGGMGRFGGFVQVLGDLGPVTINGDVTGGGSAFTGGIQSGGKIGNVVIRGDLTGTDEDFTGVIFTGNDDLPDSILAFPGDIGTVTIRGSIVGGGGEHSGAIKADNRLGKVTVTGNLEGGAGDYSGAIQARGDLAGIVVNGSLRGHAGAYSGSIFTGSPDLPDDPNLQGGTLGPVQVGVSILGGTGAYAGSLVAKTKLTSAVIAGSLEGRAVSAGDHAGSIVSEGTMGAVTVKGSVLGGSVATAGAILAEGGALASVTIGRDLVSRGAAGGIYSAGVLTSVKVGGSVIGESPTAPALIVADGTPNPVTAAKAVAIGSVAVGGRVENTQILAGSAFHAVSFGGVANADAGIGTVSVTGDWIASSIAAGVEPGAGGLFGDSGDVLAANNVNPAVPSKIAAIVIKGNLFGTPDTSGDSFAFTAQQIGAITLRGQKQTLSASAIDDRLLGANLDVVVRELGGN